jgi:hypothetical protein
MDIIKADNNAVEREARLASLEPQGADAPFVTAWEQIDTGRYQPRRIRGSCRGRELG